MPIEVLKKIESHWNELIESGKTFTRGDVFSISETKALDDGYEIGIALSDYAHYLASIHGTIEEEFFCRVVHSSVMIETSDDFLVFGEMNSNTALPGRIQCIGGGITRNDLSADGKIIDIEKNAATEMLEEIGISVFDDKQVSKFYPWAMVESGLQKFIGVVFWVKLSLTLEQLEKHYESFEEELRKKGEKPELAKIVCVSKSEKDKEFILNKNGNPFAEYLPIMFKNMK